jgi:anti-sigma factor RsiW
MEIGMTCQDAIALLLDYLEATLDDATVAQLEAHLADCAPCRAYLATYRRAVGVAGTTERIEMPPEMRERLASFLAQRLRGRSGQA